MKKTLNLCLLILLVLSLGTGVVLFGGILPAHTLLFYGLLGALVTVWGLKWVLCRRVSGAWSPLHLPVILFFVYAVIRYFTSPIEHDARLALFHVGLYTTVYFLASQNLYRSRDRLVILCALVGLAVAESFYAVWQYQTGGDHVLWLDRSLDYRGRGSGTYYCPNHLAGFLELALGLLAGWLVVYRNPNAPLQNAVLRGLIAVAAVGFIALGLFTTGSRGSWIAIVATIPLLLLLAEATRAASSRTVIILFVLFACIVGGIGSMPSIRHRFGQSLELDLQYRLGEQPLEVKGGFGGRTAIWRGTLGLIRDYPVFGTGPGTWQWTGLKYRLPESQVRPQYAHSDPLQLLAEYGVTGGVLMLAVFVCFYWQAIRLARATVKLEQRAFALGALTAVTAILIHSFVDFNFHIPANALVVAVLLGLIAAQNAGPEAEERSRVPLMVKTALGMAVIAIGLGGLWAGGALSLASRAATRGFAAAQELEWDEALQSYRQGLRLDPRSPEIHALIGDAYRQQSEQIDEPELAEESQLIARRAIDAYHRALEYNPYQSEVMLKMAAACELAGDPALAFRWLQQALRIDPANAFNWIRLGTFYHRQGDTAQAITAVEHARKLNPADWDAVNVLKEIRTGAP